MSRYITWPEVSNRYPDIARIAGAEQVNSAWIYAAESEVDARLAVKYVTPFTAPAPDIVRDLAIDLVYYKATLRQKSSEKLYAYITDRFTSLINGTMVIDVVGVTEPGTATTKLLGLSDRGTAFGLDSSLNWEPSESGIETSKGDRL